MVFETGVFLNAALLGLAQWVAQNFVQPFVTGFAKGNPIMLGVLMAVAGGLLVSFGGSLPFTKLLGKGAIAAGTIVALSSMLAPIAQSIMVRV